MESVPRLGCLLFMMGFGAAACVPLVSEGNGDAALADRVSSLDSSDLGVPSDASRNDTVTNGDVASQDSGMEDDVGPEVDTGPEADAGLGTDTGSGADVAPRCVPGMSISCACTDGRTGAQVCQPDLTFGPCSCTFDGGVVSDTSTGTDTGPGADVPAPFDAGGSRIVVLDAATCDPSVVLPLADQPGYTWWHICYDTPVLGATSTHPATSVRPAFFDFEQHNDATLPAWLVRVTVPAGTGAYRSSVAVRLVGNPNSSLTGFNALLYYASLSNPIYAIAFNRPGEATLETNGVMAVYSVVGGRQTLRASDNIPNGTGAGCTGGNRHVIGTPCPAYVTMCPSIASNPCTP